MKSGPTEERDGLIAESHDAMRRNLLIGGGLAAGEAFAGRAGAQAGRSEEVGRTDVHPRELDGQPVPEPPPERSAGPIKAGRGTVLAGKVAVVTGAARGIGRAIAVELGQYKYYSECGNSRARRHRVDAL